MQVVDPVKSSYGVDNAIYAVGQLAQTTMRSELGKITLDKVCGCCPFLCDVWCKSIRHVPIVASVTLVAAIIAGKSWARNMCCVLPMSLLLQTFEEREALNTNIVKSINEAAEAWGLQCLR